MSTKSHYNAVASGIDQSILRGRREAHNEVKSASIQESLFLSGVCSSVTVLDLACGRGGDLPKFKGYTVDYHAVDIAELAVIEAQRRFCEMKISGTFKSYIGDAASVDLPLDGNVDVAIMNFALHYFTGSEKHCSELIQQVAKCLKPGGVFCGVYTRSLYVANSPYTSATHWPTLGEFTAQPWGRRYMFDMPPFVRGEEFMVPMNSIIDIAYKNKLYLLKNRGIAEYAASKGIVCEHVDPMYGVFMFIRI